FIYADVHGVFGNLFCDFGVTFVVRDPFGEPPKEFFIGHVEKVSRDQLNIKVYGDRRHQLETGNVVRFTELCGMTELNDRAFVVNIISASEFFINVNTDSLSPYTGGGMGTQVIVPQVQSYESMLKQLRQPTIVTTDLSRPTEGLMLHLTFLALAKFRQDKGRYPEPWDESDWISFRQGFQVLLELFPDKVRSCLCGACMKCFGLDYIMTITV
ncbi:Ubiquitin modifier-activating enzyme 6, partial [Fasciola gigantica]